jgi:hypothetical protein
LPFPQTEICVEKNSFSVCRRGEIKNYGPAEQDVSWSLSALLWAMEKSLGPASREEGGEYTEGDSN